MTQSQQLTAESLLADLRQSRWEYSVAVTNHAKMVWEQRVDRALRAVQMFYNFV